LKTKFDVNRKVDVSVIPGCVYLIHLIHLIHILSYYKLGNFCVCVCLCVCMSVCPAIRFHSSQRIFSKFGGNLLRVMTRSVGYIFCVCACVLNARACVHSLIFEQIICWEHTSTHHKCQGLCTFHVHVPRARVRD
jgi:hypothetical protein